MFKHIKENRYIVDQNRIVDITTKIDTIISSVSDKSIVYNYAITNELFKNILARYMTSEFLLKHRKVFDQGIPHVVISIDINGLDLIVTISNLGDDGFAYGCIENK